MRYLLCTLAGCGSLSYYPDRFDPDVGDGPGDAPSDEDPGEDPGDEPPEDEDGDGEASRESGGEDCDDEDDSVYPGAPELCDGADNDCDDLVDDDEDEDGADVCEDCDDSDGDRFPGADETCDGVDSDCDEIDCLEWAEDFESGALGNPWDLGGADPWYAYTVAQQGQWSAKSGEIAHSERSTMKLEADFPSGGSVSFWYSVSSESGYDFLIFLVDGAERGSWSGILDWQEASYQLGPGSHTLEWRYLKDASLNDGLDGALVDTIEVVGGSL